MTTPRWTVPAILASALAAYAAGRCSAPDPPALPAPVVLDSLPARQWRESAERLRRMVQTREGVIASLADRLRGFERQPPRVVEHYDTVIDVRWRTVYLGLTATDGGRLAVRAALPADSSGTRQAARFVGYDLSRCDDGWALAGDPPVLACDRATLGHLSLFARAGAEADPRRLGTPAPIGAVGLRWRHCYRWGACPWAVEVRARTTGRVELVAEVGWSVF